MQFQGKHNRLFYLFLILFPICLGKSAKVRVDTLTGTFRDSYNRTRIFHGTNFVQKSPPYYPVITQREIDDLVGMGVNVVRLGCMMSGLFPSNSTPSMEYLRQIKNISETLWRNNNIYTIIDLHQDVLAPKLCGEGTPDWMLNVSSLNALPLPEPLSWNYKNFSQKNCHPVGWLSFLGWSEWYMTDAVGKAFENLYHGQNIMSQMFDKYWHVVSSYFNAVDGILAYELLNEPWIGDYIKHPDLLLKAGSAEKLNVGVYMKRAHAKVRENDKETPVLFSPAELNNRAFRQVGYNRGFLHGEPMAFHVYCLVGTDGDGPDNPFEIEICKLDDNFTLSQRNKDLLRLQTAGFVTEFGAVNGVSTGLHEVRRVADAMDAMSPPISWCFWDHNEPKSNSYRKELARSYESAVPGLLLYQRFNTTTSFFEFAFEQMEVHDKNVMEIFLSKQYHYPNGFKMSFEPQGCCNIGSMTKGSFVNVLVNGQNTSGYSDGKRTIKVMVLPK